MGKSLAIVAILAAAAVSGLSRDARANLVWNVNSSSSVADYNPSLAGNERRFTYEVSNLSEESAGDEAIKSFTLNFGSNKGIYGVEAPQGWSPNIGANTTSFEAGDLGDLIREVPFTFTVYSASPYTGVEMGTAGAKSEFEESFPGANVESPKYLPEPTTSALLGLGGLMALKRRKKSLNKK